MQDLQPNGGNRTEYAPMSDTSMGVSPVISVELAEDEEVRWCWTHHPNGQSVVTGYDIVKRAKVEGAFDFQGAVAEWLNRGNH